MAISGVGGSGMELFDMEYDPKQYNNLAGNPHYAEVVEEMQEKLKQKIKETRTNDLGKVTPSGNY